MWSKLKSVLAHAQTFAKNKKGQTTKAVVGLLVAIIVAVNLIPMIADTIAGATNLTTAQSNLLALIPTFVVLGLLVMGAKKMGLF